MQSDYARLILDESPDAVVLTTTAAEVVHWTRAAEQLFGYTAEAATGRLLAELIVPPERHESEQQQLDQTLRSGVVAYEAVHSRQDGTLVHLDVSSKLVVGEPPVVLRAYRDVTERRRIERALNDKTIELENAAAAREQLLATMSHDLRTPMNAILGYSGTLLMRLPGPLTPEQERQLTTIQTSSRHLLSLINNMLDLGKGESHKGGLE